MALLRTLPTHCQKHRSSSVGRSSRPIQQTLSTGPRAPRTITVAKCAASPAFSALCEAHGAVSQLDLMEGAYGRGLFATETYASKFREDELLTLPLTSLSVVYVKGGGGRDTEEPEDEVGFMQHVPTAHPLANLIADESLGAWHRLALQLLYLERHGGPAWEVYCAEALPSKEAAVSPMRVPAAVLRAITDERLRQSCVEQRANACDLWERHGAEIGELLGAGQHDYLWALEMAATRSFQVVLRDGSEIAAMAPVIDMANHSFDPNADFEIDDVDGEFRLTRRCEAGVLAEGSEVNICYSPVADNTELLSKYGFAVAGNPNERLQLPPSVRAAATQPRADRVDTVLAALADGGREDFPPMPECATSGRMHTAARSLAALQPPGEDEAEARSVGRLLSALREIEQQEDAASADVLSQVSGKTSGPWAAPNIAAVAYGVAAFHEERRALAAALSYVLECMICL